MLYNIANSLVAIRAHNYLYPLSRTSRLHHNNAFSTPHSNCNYHRYSFFPFKINPWNALLEDTMNYCDLDYFKANVLISQNTKDSPVVETMQYFKGRILPLENN